MNILDVTVGPYRVVQDFTGNVRTYFAGVVGAHVDARGLVIALATEVQQLRQKQEFLSAALELPGSTLRDIAAERARQPSADVDDKYTPGELAEAGASLALCAYDFCKPLHQRPSNPPCWWPWSRSKWKARPTREALVRAAALIAAEIDAYDRRQENTK